MIIEAEDLLRLAKSCPELRQLCILATDFDLAIFDGWEDGIHLPFLESLGLRSVSIYDTCLTESDIVVEEADIKRVMSILSH